MVPSFMLLFRIRVIIVVIYCLLLNFISLFEEIVFNFSNLLISNHELTNFQQFNTLFF